MISMYDQFLKEASNPALLDLLLTHYEDLADTQHELFIEMRDRNFYPVENAETQKLEQTLNTLKQAKKDYKKDFE